MSDQQVKKFPSDIEISRAAKLLPIAKIAANIGIDPEDIIPYGKYKAKIPLSYINEDKIKESNLILVTAVTPNKAGVGKTVTSVASSLGLNYIGKKTAVALREPSLGPCFGMKGGAAGGGYSQVLPMDEINLHFTGDFHAITCANNMIAALLDNYQYQNRKNDKGLERIVWRRVLDVNDRSLRQIVTGLGGTGNGIPTEAGFDITTASEIMALLCLATDLDDLLARIERIVLGFRFDKTPFTVKDLGVAEAITVLLKDAIMPNLVQTTENTTAFIHGGPFANIAHGCNSVIATKMAMSSNEYVVTEAGFGSDLGAEKFLDIKCRLTGLTPKATVIVVTTGALKLHGGVADGEISKPNKEAMITGLGNLRRHINNMKEFGQSVIVSFNRHKHDNDDEVGYLENWCGEEGVAFAINNGFTTGGEGAAALGKKIVEVVENNPSKPINFAYDLEDSIGTKIEKIAKRVYKAGEVTFSQTVENKIKSYTKNGWANLPICIAKTQYSFSDDPKRVNAPEGFSLHIRDIVIQAGAGFIVAIAGEIMRMPGLPEDPQAYRIKLVDGEIEGLS
ncbi:formate--tetrahydrofolate ligase [Flavipsychrobacter stenotrophus]|uniref:Formate--tetrahydrofolate ligase n=1 Tax=Flavipsychrobacter stenotrophus TaxID=2077091 RepID=A0A2S7T019_9BACT|nr:formate--tetrahydrofolate ligase [Flavipsychrobacter stenotrophus]PQJ12304.1 formate--tetrahydrofolate ligase [Flavipsychrobacter stenotrophus]